MTSFGTRTAIARLNCVDINRLPFLLHPLIIGKGLFIQNGKAAASVSM